VNPSAPAGLLKSLLAEPLTRTLDVDDPNTTELRLQIIKKKPLVRLVYDAWYRLIVARIPTGDGSVLELGSGSGYFRDFVPDLIRSDVFFCTNADLVVDARHLPFSTGSLKAIVMTDVFHHIQHVELFLREATRCLRPGGRIVMIEPWVSHWSKFIWKVHPEPFLPEAPTWDIPHGGPLSHANIALPWIVFVRDKGLLHANFPELAIQEVLPMMPFLFLVSGGLSLRSLVPARAYRSIERLERMLLPWMDRLGMFALFDLVRG
jgi:SAM-dependent methyltransferase